MQSEEYHKLYGRGRNISCSNYNCSNFRKKIGRVRSGWNAHDTVCPICHKRGYTHSYHCKVGKDNMMLCECHLNCCRCV